jgi:group II intron reverse transcriptase/maturase
MNKDNERPPAASADEGTPAWEPLFAMALLAESRSAESMEGRGLTKENTGQSPLDRTQSRSVDGQWPSQGLGQPSTARSRGLLGVREAARKDKTLKFTSLLHHLTPQLLRASFFQLKKLAAPGVDEQTWHDYAEEIDRRIADLHGRIHRGAYQAKPSKRTYIPKLDGKMRPLGIAAVEDKVVQQAARTVLECIYEEDFLGVSYGFRPKRSAHQALDALYVGIKSRKVNWIIDADIRGFFDNICHEWLVKFLKHRIADHRMLRLLKKWLKAGVSEDGEWSATNVGTPQGAVISPLFANVFLHYVLDLWIDAWRKRHAKGEVIVVRYADDFVIGFREESDARRCLAALKERMTKFGLELHPEKTRLIAFGRYAEERRAKRGEGPPETFDFLGFTHISGKTRRGDFTIHRKTARKKFQAKLQDLKVKLQRNLHAALPQVGSWLQSVLRGWFRYNAVPGNYPRLQQFRDAVQKMWLRALRRRSQRGRRFSWERFARVCKRWLPSPKIEHPYPDVRFAANHPR